MKDMNWLKTNYIAHRGLHTADIPENSLEAFLHASNNGYDIELDLQLSKDKKLIIIHDHNLLRLCGLNERVDRLNYGDLEKLRLNNTDSKIPLFTDVLDVLPSTTNLMIELKTGKRNKELIDIFLDAIKRYNFTYVVQSFDPRIVSMMKKIAPNIPTGYISRDKHVNCRLINFIIKILPIHTWIRPDYYIYKMIDLPNKKMDKMKEKGVPVFSYTAKSKEDLQTIRERYDNAVFEGFMP